MEPLPGLRAGDVLLLRSPGAAAWAARLFDGAEVDRAALCLGEGRVAEGVDGAIAERSLDECLAGSERAIARRLKITAAMEPVLARAAALRQERVAASIEVKLALLCCSRKLRATPGLRGLQRAALEAGAAGPA